jgi:hypothetical protein
MNQPAQIMFIHTMFCTAFWEQVAIFSCAPYDREWFDLTNQEKPNDPARVACAVFCLMR